MKRLTEVLFGLQRGERGTALLLTAYHFLILLCLYLLKPARDGLFLTDRGAAELPLVFLLVAAVTVPAGLFQRWLGGQFERDRLTNRLTGALAAILLVVSFWVASGLPGGAYAVYTTVSIFGVMATSQFWLFAGSLLTSTQSKRVFSVLNLGGILGAVAGGELTGWLLDVGWIAPTGLLLLAGAILVGTLPLVAWIRRYHQNQGPRTRQESRSATGNDDAATETAGNRGKAHSPSRDRDPDESTGTMLTDLRQTVASYPLVGWIAGLIAIISIVSTLLDYQLKAVALAHFPGKAEVTAFLGHFYGRVSLVAFAIQLLLSSGLKRYIRSTSTLWVLPLALAMGATALAVVPALAAVTFLRGADQSLKHSVDKTGREILYLPLPQRVKRRIKVPLDLIVDQAAYGVGGVLLLGLVSGLGLSPVEIGPVVALLAIVWMTVVYRARTAYVDEFRSAIKEVLDRSEAADEAPTSTPPNGSTAPLPTDAPRTNGETSSPDEESFLDGPFPEHVREQALRRGARYLVCSQLLGLRNADEDGQSTSDSRLPPTERLRVERHDALDDLFDVLVEWIPKAQDCDAEDLRLARDGLQHSSDAVRSDAVSLLDGLLRGSIRRRLVPLLNDPTGARALDEAPPLYRFAVWPSGYPYMEGRELGGEGETMIPAAHAERRDPVAS
jgi:ATP/ADP translocase